MQGNRSTSPGPVRLVAIVMTTILALGALIAPAAVADETAEAPGPCPLKQREGEGAKAYSKRLIRCAAGIWKVPGGVKKAFCIAKRESGFNPKALSPDKLNRGIYQQHRAYWKNVRKAYTKRAWKLRSSAFNARTNIIVSIRMAADPDVRWKPWGGPRCEA